MANGPRQRTNISVLELQSTFALPPPRSERAAMYPKMCAVVQELPPFTHPSSRLSRRVPIASNDNLLGYARSFVATLGLSYLARRSGLRCGGSMAAIAVGRRPSGSAVTSGGYFGKVKVRARLHVDRCAISTVVRSHQHVELYSFFYLSGSPTAMVASEDHRSLACAKIEES